MKRNSKATFVTQAAIIASLYVSLTYLSSLVGLSSGMMQIRFSEALTVLPYFTFAAVPGLFVGCLIANIITGAAIWDVIFGSIATLLGAVFTYLLRNKTKWLAPIPPIISNTLIIPWVIAIAYGYIDVLSFVVVTVFIGEIISCGILGIILIKCLEKYRNHIFSN